MVITLFFTVLLANSALCANLPRYAELDEEDQLLFRAAYDTPSYEHEQYQETEEPGKLDLLKDGMWALKTNMKQLKVFDKALAANLLATKLQVKQLLGTLKKHKHIQIEKKGPVYHYQSPPPAYHQYEAPHYSASAPEHHYSTSQGPQYAPPQHVPPKYEPPVQYESHSYGNPAPPKYEPSSHYYESKPYVPSSHKYEPSVHYESQAYEPAPHYPQVHIEPPQYTKPEAGPVYGHDPYYGY